MKRIQFRGDPGGVAFHQRRAAAAWRCALDGGVATPLAINLAAIGEAPRPSTHRLQGAGVHLPVRRQRLRQHRRSLRREQLRAVPDHPHAGSTLPHDTLLPSDAQRRRCPAGLQIALAPELTGLKSLWDPGRLAVQLNVGPLIQPTTLAQYQSAAQRPLPPKLFSHNDQQSVWQSNGPKARRWAGADARRHHAEQRQRRPSPASTRPATRCSCRARARCSTRSSPAARSRSPPCRRRSTARSLLRRAQGPDHRAAQRNCSRTNTPSSRAVRSRGELSSALAGAEPRPPVRQRQSARRSSSRSWRA